jgi:hypothetical protein
MFTSALSALDDIDWIIQQIDFPGHIDNLPLLA